MAGLLQFLKAGKYTLGALALVALLAGSILLVPHQGGNTSTVSASDMPATNNPVATAVKPTPTIPADPLRTPTAPGTWRPIFVESFNGRTLDTTHWSTCFWWSINAPNGCEGSAANGELEWYLPENISLSGGALDITARHDHVTTSLGNYNYTSGVITSVGKFSFLYGYVEARIRVTKGRGVWPAVWMLPEDHSPATEIDIAEILGDRPQTLNTALHFLTNGAHRSVGGVYTAADFSTGYHIVAVDWEPNSITWYEDGKAVYRVTDYAQIPHKPMYLLLDSAVGGYWSGNPDQSTPFPNQFRVDWMQVWSHTPAPAATATTIPGA